MSALRGVIELAARSHAKVLILGETGAGKEVVARSIHEQSARRGRPFVAVNCSGIPETLLESELFGHTRGSFTGAYRDKVGLIRQAHGGTLFLDELGEMSLRMQAMLLRFAETGEVHTVGSDTASPPSNVRLITATNRDLRAQIENGAFREDLYYRLNVIQIHVAPLRERPEDVPALLDHFLRIAVDAHGTIAPALTPDAIAALRAYAWPGNVRELRNVTERLALGDWSRPLTASDLPIEVRPTMSPMNSARSTTRAAMHGLTVADDAAPTEFHAHPLVERLFARFAAGENFWSVVHQPFKVRELTRQDLKHLIDAGLRRTRGSYRELLSVFNLPASDYKRFHAFLYQQRCNLPVWAYRHTPREAMRVSSVSDRRLAVA